MQQVSSIEAEKLYEKYSPELLNKKAQDEHPVAILLGGQPASGKSSLVSKACFDNPQKTFIKVNGDIYRAFHPNYETLTQQPDIYSQETQIISNVFTEKLIEDAIKNKYNIIIEGTMRNPDIPMRTAKQFKENGFVVNCYVISAPIEVTSVGIYNRFQEEINMKGVGRLADIKSHYDAFIGLNKSLDMLYNKKAVDSIHIYNLYAKERIAVLRYDGQKWNNNLSPSYYIETSRQKQLNNENLLLHELEKGKNTLNQITMEYKPMVREYLTRLEAAIKEIDNPIKKGLHY